MAKPIGTPSLASVIQDKPPVSLFHFIVLSALRALDKPASATDIVEHLDIAIATGDEASPYGRALAALARDGLVRRIGHHHQAHVGRPRLQYDMTQDGHAAIAATRTFYEHLVRCT